MKRAERKIPHCYQTPNAEEERERGGKKCLFSSSTSFSWRRCGQVTFMETLFLDCSLAGVHYSSALRWNILCKMSAYVNEDSALIRMSCFVKSCCNLSFLLISGFPLAPSSSPVIQFTCTMIHICFEKYKEMKRKNTHITWCWSNMKNMCYKW